MRHICSNTFRKSITLIMMFFLTAVCCVSFDVSYDSFTTGGSIKGFSQATIILIFSAPLLIYRP